MARYGGQVFSATRNLWLKGTGTRPGSIRFERGSTDPGYGASDGDFLYNLNGNLVYEAAGTTTTLGAVGGVGTTWESLYTNDNAWSLNGAFTITQSGATAFTIDKTNTGAGTAFAIQNAGTGVDLAITNVTAGATGVVLNTYANSASAADADVIFEHLVRGNDDNVPTVVSYGRVRWIAADTGSGSEDATFQVAMMLAGTLRTTLDITGDLMIYGTGQAAAVITSSGANDLILETNSGTNSGTIRIYDGANGNIEFLNNGSGDVTIPTSGIVQGGTTATRSTFATDGTTGQGFSITSATITSGDVVRINHSVAATLNAGFLLNCTVESNSVFSVGEDGSVVIAGTAAGSAITLTLGNLVLSQGTVAVTSTGTGDVVSVTANSVLANNGLIVTGSGTFTGTGANSWVNITASGLTTGTALTVIANTATTSVGVVDFSATGLTSGSLLRMTVDTATFTTGGKMIELTSTAAVAGNHLTCTTTGAYSGTGMILVTAGAATSGILVSLVSTTGMTSGSLLRMTTSTAGAVATNGICSIRATGAYTSTSNIGLLDVEATATTAGTVCRIAASAAAQTTSELLRVVASGYTTGYTGAVMSVTGVGTTGDGNVLLVTSAQTTAGNAIDVDCNGITTGGVGINISHTTSVIGAGSSMLRITSTGSDTGTTTGCLLDLASSAATAGTLVLMTSATLATGSGMVMALAGLTTGVGLSMTHATAVIASGGSMFRLNSGGIDTATTTGCLVDLTSTASTAGTQVLMTFSGLTTGIGMRMVGNAITSGIMVDLETSAAGFSGTYIRCFDGAAVDFSVAADGAVVQTSGLNTTVYALTADSATTLGAAANDGIVNLSGDGLTTGTALNIGLTEGTLTTGRYIKCWDVTGGVEVFSVQEDGVVLLAEGQSATAGGAIAASIGASAAIDVVWGSGAPTLTASQGSLYLRTDGSSTSTRLYVNTDGAGTWTNVTTAA